MDGWMNPPLLLLLELLLNQPSVNLNSSTTTTTNNNVSQWRIITQKQTNKQTNKQTTKQQFVKMANLAMVVMVVIGEYFVVLEHSFSCWFFLSFLFFFLDTALPPSSVLLFIHFNYYTTKPNQIKPHDLCINNNNNNNVPYNNKHAL
jgi:hypothetical protein